MISMLGMIDTTFGTHVANCVNFAEGDYNDDGIWTDAENDTFEVLINVQPLDKNAVVFLTGNGGTVDINACMQIHINNGKQVYHDRQTPDSTIQASHVTFEFEGFERTFKVIFADNRPHHGYCMAYVEMMNNV